MGPLLGLHLTMDSLGNEARSLGTMLVELSATLTSGVSLEAAATMPAFSFWGSPPDDQTPFEREKRAFLRKRAYLRQHAGEFVAIHGGQVAASAKSRNEVLRKFFADHPAGTSVYVGFVGPKPVARISAQLFAKRPR